MIAGKAAVEVARATKRAFADCDHDTWRWSPDFREALESDDLPPSLIAELANGSVARTKDSILKLKFGYLLHGAPFRSECMEYLKVATSAEAGEEALRRLATIARKKLVADLDYWSGPGFQDEVEETNRAISALDGEMVAAGYRWTDSGFRRDTVTAVAQVPSVPALVDLVTRAKLANEALLLSQLELAEQGLAQGGPVGWQAASDKARDAMAKVFEGVALKVQPGVRTTSAAAVRDALEQGGVVDSSQKTRLQLVYKALCETAHNVSSREDAVFDMAAALAASEFVLKRYLTRLPPSSP